MLPIVRGELLHRPRRDARGPSTSAPEEPTVD
jgi:hypothetical protein